ncbi:hypothetical protein SORBI_3004G147200 [Sorghum bicolor]|uniref:Uncharacterized protein n=1 Tax=Sorghum bicolor TaxID=4558 RepID=A0A194YPR4_SORBI|nr:hypothetical protein SORBI_3004G147200 [Sorghum bicolor]OQU84949.1 hypothetical protein SORBI_3004G147200 [Sorghum bicolor]
MPHHSTSVPWPQVATVGRATSGLDACNPASHRMTSHLIPNTSGRQRWRQGNPSRRHIPVAVGIGQGEQQQVNVLPLVVVGHHASWSTSRRRCPRLSSGHPGQPRWQLRSAHASSDHSRPSAPVHRPAPAEEYAMAE